MIEKWLIPETREVHPVYGDVTLSLGTAAGRSLILLRLCSWKTKCLTTQGKTDKEILGNKCFPFKWKSLLIYIGMRFYSSSHPCCVSYISLVQKQWFKVTATRSLWYNSSSQYFTVMQPLIDVKYSYLCNISNDTFQLMAVQTLALPRVTLTDLFSIRDINME